MTAALLRWSCLSLCYLAFAGSFSRAEGIAAALAGGFGAALSLGLRARGERRFSLHGRWIAVVAEVAWLLVRDCGRVGATLIGALLRGHRGEVVRDRGAAARPIGHGAGHRAATTLLASLTPDSMALETDDEAIPLHRLAKSPEAARARRRRR
ncbi:MAG TPA: hypothetical protein VFX20_20205 [Steroidobacteraceae bacterium]|nr:hypothetical protein [Steroidobacteraceae bacterium]